MVRLQGSPAHGVYPSVRDLFRLKVVEHGQREKEEGESMGAPCKSALRPAKGSQGAPKGDPRSPQKGPWSPHEGHKRVPKGTPEALAVVRAQAGVQMSFLRVDLFCATVGLIQRILAFYLFGICGMPQTVHRALSIYRDVITSLS